MTKGKIHIPTVIEKMGLDVRIKEMYESGKSQNEIVKILHSEGVDVLESTIKYHIRTRLSKPKTAPRIEAEKRRDVLKDLSPELKLTEAITEAWGKYESFKDVKGKEKDASDWFKQYSELVEKLLKSTGVYERAKQEVQKDDDKKIEVYWVFQHICPKCNDVFEESTEIHTTYSVNDMQIEEVKDQVVEEMSEPSLAIDGKKEDASNPL